jgi:NifU-like protein involved in Fe-S cluster formation
MPELIDREVKTENPLCGDQFPIQLALDGEHIVTAVLSAPTIAVTAVSLSLELLVGFSLSDVRSLAPALRRALRNYRLPERLGSLATLLMVSVHSSRGHCVPLIWVALEGALDGEDNS